MRAAIMLALGLMLASSSAFACAVYPFRSLWDQAVEAHMIARAGVACGVRITNSVGGIQRIHVFQRPASGRAGALRGVIGYLPKPGFTGSDVFAYRLFGPHALTGKPSVATVRVNVTVTR